MQQYIERREEGDKAAVLCGKVVAGMWVFPQI
jgi:glutathione synthase/RimK-type ligase-like ATP-grasp enzyme